MLLQRRREIRSVFEPDEDLSAYRVVQGGQGFFNVYISKYLDIAKKINPKPQTRLIWPRRRDKFLKSFDMN